MVTRPADFSKVPLREGAAGTRFQISLEIDSALLVWEFDGDVQLPGTVARGVRAAAGVVVGGAGGYVVGVADVVMGFGMGTRQHVDESPVVGHPKREGNVDAERPGRGTPGNV
jgi:hypothetical protein